MEKIHYTAMQLFIGIYLKMVIFFSLFLDFPGSLQSRLDTFELTQSLQRVLGSPFKFGGKFKIFTKPYHRGVYGLPWTPATKT